MARKEETSEEDERKVRTRQHVIADLSVNHVERFLLRRGHSVERARMDYGYDLVLYTHREDGRVETGEIYLQLKATDALKVLQDGVTIAFPVDKRDMERWRADPMPVILVVYDAAADTAYWLYVQRYLQAPDAPSWRPEQKSVTFHLSRANVLNEGAVDKFREYKEAVLRQVEGRRIRHDA